MKDIILMVRTFQRIVSRYYEKEMLFFDFDTGEWYSRWQTLTTEQVCDWILEITQTDDEECADFPELNDTLPCGCCACCGCSCHDNDDN